MECVKYKKWRTASRLTSQILITTNFTSGTWVQKIFLNDSCCVSSIRFSFLLHLHNWLFRRQSKNLKILNIDFCFKSLKISPKSHPQLKLHNKKSNKIKQTVALYLRKLEKVARTLLLQNWLEYPINRKLEFKSLRYLLLIVLRTLNRTFWVILYIKTVRPKIPQHYFLP